VVIEASRPRALAQLGVDAEAVVAARPGVTWVGITGHGRWGAGADRVAFGDDAAVAAGLVARDAAGEPVFCGDAIADPITGLYAAVGALASVAAGGGHLLDVGMAGAARFAAGTPAEPAAAVPAEPGTWVVPARAGSPRVPVARPAAPPAPPVPARPLGADTAAVLAELVPPAEGRAC
jgi:crotonobetainyl-CoA:carnitine CoA-transferase CaiB-like acyl-CoA transferase